MNQPEAKIIIVGAGAAGLGAAHYLNRENFKQVTVLEAADRIGGRVHTVHFGSTSDCIIELGANWIHGAVPSNPLYTLAAEESFFPALEPPKLVNRRVGYVYTSDGRIINKDLGIKVWDLFLKIDEDATRKGVKDVPHQSLKQYINFNKWSYKEFKNFDSDEEQRRDMHLIFNSTMFNYLSFHVGDDVDKVGVSDYGAYKELPGGDAMLPKGYVHLLNTLTRNLPHDSIRLNCHVMQIDWQSKPIKITCADGSVFKADFVIVTVSLGYFKNHHLSLFTPKLPPKKISAIESLGFGRVNKIFLQYERPFWVEGFGCIRLAWSEEEMKKRNEVEDWTKFIFGFDAVQDNPNVLVAWLSGDGAEALETLSEEKVISDCTKLLRRFTNNPMIPEAKRVRFSSWCNDELIRGSYTYLPVDCGREHISHLASSLPSSEHPTLLFAGEATHHCYFSTVHGAFLSGVRAAQDIQKYFQNSS